MYARKTRQRYNTDTEAAGVNASQARVFQCNSTCVSRIELRQRSPNISATVLLKADIHSEFTVESVTKRLHSGYMCSFSN